VYYVITSLCVEVCDTGCVQVCPVDCIDGPVDLRRLKSMPTDERKEAVRGKQLYINPEECTGCAACVSECPAAAIFEEDEVPENLQSAIKENAAFFRQR
jgi:ferredoxin